MVIFVPQIRDFIQSGLRTNVSTNSRNNTSSSETPTTQTKPANPVIANRPVVPAVVVIDTPKKLPPPGWLNRDHDPSKVSERLWNPVKDAFSEAKPDVQRQAERLVFDSQARELTRERFQARRPWEGSESSFVVIPSNQIHSTGVLGMIWQTLKDALGYVVWNFQDLQRYFSQSSRNGWSWLDLSRDVGFLWRLGVTALISMGVIQLVGVTDSLVRLVDGLMGILSRLFGMGWDVLNSIRTYVAEILFDN